MAAIIILLALLILVSVVISGVVYTRQQAIVYRENKTRHLQQKYQELDKLFKFFMSIDDNPELAILLNNQSTDLAQQLSELNKKTTDFQSLFDQLKARAHELKTGSLAP